MELKVACDAMLNQVAAVIDQIDNSEFTKPTVSLNGASLGQHFRHAIEFFQCLELGATSGNVCYDHRKHDITLESDKDLAIQTLHALNDFISKVQLDQPLSLTVSYAADSNEAITIPTHMAREIVYNIEHLVHHMALVKIGIREHCPHILLPPDFGVAVSTIKYNQGLA